MSEHYHDDDCPASRTFPRWHDPLCTCKSEQHTNAPMPADRNDAKALAAERAVKTLDDALDLLRDMRATLDAERRRGDMYAAKVHDADEQGSMWKERAEAAERDAAAMRAALERIPQIITDMDVKRLVTKEAPPEARCEIAILEVVRAALATSTGARLAELERAAREWAEAFRGRHRSDATADDFKRLDAAYAALTFAVDALDAERGSKPAPEGSER